jgi:hypothetical protein
MRDFGYLNKKIEEHVLEIQNDTEMSLEEYVDFMRTIYKMSNNMMGTMISSRNAYQKQEPSYKKGISLDETLHIVLKFLRQIDPELVFLFKDAILKKIILFHTPKELQKLEEKEDNFYYYYNLAGIYNGKYVVNIVLENTIQDAFVIVHEFMHYISMKSTNPKSIAWLHFTEGYSHAFELLLLDFLKQTKWQTEAKKYHVTNTYAMYLRNCIFRQEFIYLDVFVNYGSFTPQKVFKYCEEEPMTSRILKNAKIEEQFLLNQKATLGEYLESSRYVLAIPFAYEVLDRFPEEKDTILKEHRNLEEYSISDLMNKYDLEGQHYQKILHM